MQFRVRFITGEKVTAGTQYRYSNKIKIIAKQAVARNAPVAVTPPAGTQPILTIPAYTGLSSADFNKVHHYGVEKPGVLTQTQLAAKPGGQVKKSMAYVDGMGRNIQTVNVKASLSAKDIVNLNVYDQYGERETTFHLPYSAATTTQNAWFFRDRCQYRTAGISNKQLMGSDKDYFYGKLIQEDASLSRFAATQRSGKTLQDRNIGGSEEIRFNTENDKGPYLEIRGRSRCSAGKSGLLSAGNIDYGRQPPTNTRTFPACFVP